MLARGNRRRAYKPRPEASAAPLLCPRGALCRTPETAEPPSARPGRAPGRRRACGPRFQVPGRHQAARSSARGNNRADLRRPWGLRVHKTALSRRCITIALMLEYTKYHEPIIGPVSAFFNHRTGFCLWACAAQTLKDALKKRRGLHTLQARRRGRPWIQGRRAPGIPRARSERLRRRREVVDNFFIYKDFINTELVNE